MQPFLQSIYRRVKSEISLLPSFRFPSILSLILNGNTLTSQRIFCGVLYIVFRYCWPGSSVGIATDYGLDGPGSNPGGDEIFRPSRPALGPTQPPVKWVKGLSLGVKCGRGVLLTTHFLLVPRSWKSKAIPLPTLWATPGL